MDMSGMPTLESSNPSQVISTNQPIARLKHRHSLLSKNGLQPSPTSLETSPTKQKSYDYLNLQKFVINSWTSGSLGLI